MARKRIPVDCKRITEKHLCKLSRDDLMEVNQRIEIQTQALHRARRLVFEAVDQLDD